jgi:hypothetical protein
MVILVVADSRRLVHLHETLSPAGHRTLRGPHLFRTHARTIGQIFRLDCESIQSKAGRTNQTLTSFSL